MTSESSRTKQEGNWGQSKFPPLAKEAERWTDGQGRGTVRSGGCYIGDENFAYSLWKLPHLTYSRPLSVVISFCVCSIHGPSSFFKIIHYLHSHFERIYMSRCFIISIKQPLPQSRHRTIHHLKSHSCSFSFSFYQESTSYC